jgi:hypothetical protein
MGEALNNGFYWLLAALALIYLGALLIHRIEIQIGGDDERKD